MIVELGVLGSVRVFVMLSSRCPNLFLHACFVLAGQPMSSKRSYPCPVDRGKAPLQVSVSAKQLSQAPPLWRCLHVFASDIKPV